MTDIVDRVKEIVSHGIKDGNLDLVSIKRFEDASASHGYTGRYTLPAVDIIGVNVHINRGINSKTLSFAE